ncbi:MAG TPA: DUF2442 domain-containing protein [Planctomycetota bacterium]
MKPILRLTALEVAGPHSLRVSFNHGVTKQVNLRPLLWGSMFEPLLDPTAFARVRLDPSFGVPSWPNGADLAPEALLALPDERGDAA